MFIKHSENLLWKEHSCHTTQCTFASEWRSSEYLYNKYGERLFTKACSNKTRVNDFKLKESRFRRDTGEKFFMMKVVRNRNRSPPEAVGAPPLALFKARLDKAFSNLV